MLQIIMLLVIAMPINEELHLKFQGEKIGHVTRSEYSVPLLDIPVINTIPYAELTNKLDAQIRKAPENAKLDDYGNIVTEKLGHSLHKEKFRELFSDYFFGLGPATIELPIRPIYPKVDSELLSNIKTRQLSVYVTFFNSRNKERTNNITIATQAINNTVVFPGETFSFNKVVGKRTKEKGYLPAPVIVKGELSEGIGGGICQVSSTLYNAVDRAGVHIVQRYSHSRSVPYVPPGRDATVSWYGPDFVFKNKYSHPILIRARAIDGKMLIRVFSADDIDYRPRSGS
ncbi:hypothetical protein EJF36_15035 [Bacillus sp. HMF5848]|uniref:VanW family protein n=1 Tax=Bacillus sp. HMF5848 TaxID=2495421 RepID=UPI000F7A5500|nr:VanW family protein [Bacillus sp. HMF5848]RSK28087.1 hypothetical protein EJF36_15035 [Bacillus sp. HMF5848]